MLSPQYPNTLRTFPFEEIVLLLTDAALYAVRFDWNTEKVSSFERVDLQSVTGLVRGTYVTSTFVASQMNERKNVGLAVRYRPGKGDLQRRNTRSLSSDVGESEAAKNEEHVLSRLSGRGTEPEIKYLAFKSLPAQSSIADVDGEKTPLVSEEELVQSICDEIERAAQARQHEAKIAVEENAIISLEEAKKNTGYLEQWSHSLKKFVWA